MVEERVRHIRHSAFRYTVVSLFDDINMTISYGYSKVHPKDQFSRRIGRELASWRANNRPMWVEKMDNNCGFSGDGLKFLLISKIEAFIYSLPMTDVFHSNESSLCEEELYIINRVSIDKHNRRVAETTQRLLGEVGGPEIFDGPEIKGVK